MIIFILYRDRKKHLEYFLKNLIPTFKKYIPNFKIIVAEQSEKGCFNKGKLINSVFKECLNEIDEWFVIHDVDTIPSETFIKKNYNKEDYDIIRFSVPNPDALGGSVKLTKDIMIKNNGFPNNIWGWGIEDRASYVRSKLVNAKLSDIYNHHCFGSNKNFKVLPHKSNARAYKNELKTISDYWRIENFKNKSDEEIKEALKDGIKTVEYKVLSRCRINDVTEKITFEL